jgi:ParB family chromosome partitioning protein
MPELHPENVVELPLGVLERGFFQPREYFDPLAMEATLRSIQEKGQKYPVIVRPIFQGNPLFDPTWSEIHYELADGERRFRCCKQLGFDTVKAIIRTLTDEEMLDYTLTTNDSLPLNPIEKATVFSRLAKEFGKSQLDIANSFNLKQQQVSEYIRLLELPKEIQDLTARAVISVRHARELLKIQDTDQRREVALSIEKSAISTRELSKIVKKSKKDTRNDAPKIRASDIFVQDAKEAEHLPINTANSTSFGQGSLEKEPVSAIERKEITRTDLYHHEETAIPPSGGLEQLHRALIPGKLYQKFEYWLSFELGSRLKPEAWLLRVEIAIAIGVLLAVAALWLPLQSLAALLGVMCTILAYLFLI